MNFLGRVAGLHLTDGTESSMSRFPAPWDVLETLYFSAGMGMGMGMEMGNLSFLLEDLEEVAGEMEVWAFLFRLLTQHVAVFQDTKYLIFNMLNLLIFNSM